MMTDTFISRSTQVLMPSLINTTDPRNVEHILKSKKKSQKITFFIVHINPLKIIDNFENYVKGDYFNKNMGDLLGRGIFNVDGGKWKIQRKIASRIFHVKNFRDEFTK
jgi:cytochrome P450